MHVVPTAARDLLLVTAVIWAVLELRQSTNHRTEAVKTDGGSRPFLRVATVVGAIGAIAVSRWVPAMAVGSVAVVWTGLAILWCGIGLRLWSFRTLGRYFTFTVQTSADQPVIDSGPYRVIRHPSYAGVLLAVVGLGLYVGNWLSLAVLVVAVTAGMVYRILVEERALMHDVRGYPEYAATHKRLLPFVW